MGAGKYDSNTRSGLVSLLSFLEQRIEQLEHRKMMILRYLGDPNKFVGRKDFSLEDIPKLEELINEARFALDAVKAYKKANI